MFHLPIGLTCDVEINDSGVYLPVCTTSPYTSVPLLTRPSQPSPTERKNFWSTKSNSSTNSSTNHRAMLSDEPFNISRESFDSYRRSFVRRYFSQTHFIKG